MPTSQLIKIPGKGFQPFDPAPFKRVKDGEVITVSWAKARNPRFHRKGMALYKYVYDSMPEFEIGAITYEGNEIIPKATFDNTRKWMTIRAGFYDVFYNPDGSFEIEAKSLAFGSMDEDTFSELYTRLIDVALEILPHIADKAELDQAVETVLRFDGGG